MVSTHAFPLNTEIDGSTATGDVRTCLMTSSPSSSAINEFPRHRLCWPYSTNIHTAKLSTSAWKQDLLGCCWGRGASCRLPWYWR